MRWQTVPIVLLLILLLGCPDASELDKNTKRVRDREGVLSKKTKSSVRNEYILRLRKGTASERIKGLLPGFKIISIEKISEDTFHIVYESDPGIELLQSAGKKSGFVESVEPNQIYKTF